MVGETLNLSQKDIIPGSTVPWIQTPPTANQTPKTGKLPNLLSSLVRSRFFAESFDLLRIDPFRPQ